MKIIKVDLDKDIKELTIIPLSDVHIGDKLSNLKLLKECLERIKKEPHTYTIINGDFCNTALKNSKSDVYMGVILRFSKSKITLNLIDIFTLI